MKDPVILALGSDVKNQALIASRKGIKYGDVIGDLSDSANNARFKETIKRLITSSKGKPQVISCDMHPNYFSSMFANEYAKKNRMRPPISVQHHQAHIGSVVYENGLNKPVIGVSFDGTGYGTDGRLWGGEFFLVDKGDFRRMAHFRYIMLPGGDKVVFEPWRILLSILGKPAKAYLRKAAKGDIDLVLKMMDKGVNCPVSSSAGRVFDAAAVLVCNLEFARSQAQGPIGLESLCDPAIKKSYPFDLVLEDGCYIIDIVKAFKKMAQDIDRKVDGRIIATGFHNTMVKIILDVAVRLSGDLNIRDVALSGGVFQNKFLVSRVKEMAGAHGLEVYFNSTSQANDLNIALGQYYIAKNIMKGKI